MIEINVSKEMWAEWKESPVTKMFYRSIYERREEIKEALAQGKFEDREDTAVASCMSLQDILNTTFEDKSDD